jgi:4-azaleucine resistance transporter AzlC
MLSKVHFHAAVRITIPVFFGYIAIGIPFGLMLVNAGYPWWLAPIMSATMYAGAGEYIAVGLFASGAQLATIAVAQLAVNIRHIVYGLSLITKFKNTGKWKPYLIFALTDETYALLTGCTLPQGADSGSFYGTIAVLDHIYWIAGSTIGAVAGTLIPFNFAGVDFALSALFAVLLIDQIRNSRDWLPPVIGCATTTAAIVLWKFGILPGQHILIVALTAGIAAIAVVRERTSALDAVPAESAESSNSGNSANGGEK